MNTKAKGSRRERACKKELEAQGYLCTKAGASLGIFDILALSTWGGSDVLLRLIQVKSNSISKKERQLINDLKLPKMVTVRKEIWIYKDRKPVEKIVL